MVSDESGSHVWGFTFMHTEVAYLLVAAPATASWFGNQFDIEGKSTDFYCPNLSLCAISL